VCVCTLASWPLVSGCPVWCFVLSEQKNVTCQPAKVPFCG
jgi:hypothetical protein